MDPNCGEWRLFRGCMELLTGKMRLLYEVGSFIVCTGRLAMSDQDIQRLENQFPPTSGSAFAAAWERVLQSGQSVLQAENSVI